MASWNTIFATILLTLAGCGSASGGGGHPPPPLPPTQDGTGDDAPSATSLEDRVCHERVARGLAHVQAGRADAAEREFRAASREDHGCVAAYLNLSVALRQRGDLDGALLELRRALAVDAENVHALHQMILVQLARSETDVHALELAELTCRQAMQITEDWAPLQNSCGIVEVDRGHVVEALTRFERAYTLDPSLFEAWMNFGQITLSFRGYEDAEAAFRHAVALAPHDYDARIGLGVALRGLGRIDEAERQYRRAIAIAPARPEAFYDMGILSQEHRDGSVDDLRRAGELFESFVSKAGDDPRYRDEVTEVRRCCPDEPRSPGRGQPCRPGRLQIIRQSLHALGEQSPLGC